jgi:PAS domain S-box-containing protein
MTMNVEHIPSHYAPVLIVEDDEDLSFALQEQLQYQGYNVHCVMTGRAALETTESGSFSAVILDLGLPDISGFAVLRGLEELDPLLPIIILTASAQEDHTVESLRRGAFAYITKPYNRDELKIVLRQAVEVRRLAMKMSRVERDLMAKEAEFRHLVQAAPDGIVLTDGDGKIVAWNSAAERLFGYTEKEIVGLPLSTIMPARYREDHRRGLERLKATGKSELPGKTIELYGLRKNGEEFPIELSVNSWQFGGQIFNCGIIRDITQRKKSEAALHQQRVEQQVLLDLIPAMVWYKDSQNRILRANRRAAESINKTVEELEGRSTYDLYPEEAERYHQDDLAVLTSGRPKLGIVEPYEIALGQKRWVQTDKVPYRDAEGNVIGVLVFAQDITERREAALALEENERLYRFLMEKAGDGMVVVDRDGHVTMANARACAIYGYTKEEFLGMNIQETYAATEKGVFTQRLAQVGEGKSTRFERRLQRKDGRIISIEVSASKISENRYLGIIRELTVD